MKGLKIRWKLALWYGAVLACVLTVFGATVFVIMRHHLLERIDQGLNEELSDVLSEIRRAGSAASLKEWLDRRFAAHAGFDFQITQSTGERFFYNPRLADSAWPLPADSTQDPSFQTIPIRQKGYWRIVNIRAEGPNGPLTVQVGRSLAAFAHESNELLMTFLLAVPLASVVAAVGSLFLAGRVLRPIQFITQTAKAISAEKLNQRIPVGNSHDELAELAQTMNEMIERLGQSFTEMQRFTADAAHELRTPLAILRNEAEVALRQPRSTAEYCNVLENLLEETNRLSSTADQLLFLSRHDTDTVENQREHVALDALLHEICSNMQVVAQEKRISLELVENPVCTLITDGRLLRRVFINLLDNAIKYTKAGGRIQVVSRLSPGTVSVQIADTGIGIPAKDLPHVFDRFYRVDTSRSEEGTGAGLGLSICKAIIRRLDGMIAIKSEPGSGTVVAVKLPTEFDGHE
jgi:heavy metal sensor kinase